MVEWGEIYLGFFWEIFELCKAPKLQLGIHKKMYALDYSAWYCYGPASITGHSNIFKSKLKNAPATCVQCRNVPLNRFQRGHKREAM